MENNPTSRCSLFSTSCSFGPTFVRLALGVMMFPHGAQKLLGWFGGYGFTGTMQYFTGMAHIPYFLGVIVILVEFFGAIALILGLATRIAAFLVGFDLVTAMFMEHVQNGFFMNWYGNQKGEGMEFFILVAGMALGLIVLGGGALSIDGACRRLRAAPPAA